MRFMLCFAVASCLLLPPSGASCTAADVDTDVSVRETVVGLPFVLRIQISNSVKHEPPELPKVDGLKVERAGPPFRSRSISTINNRRVEKSSIIYSFRITPLREGTFIIPPVRVLADGVSRLTRAVRIVATKGETNDLLFVEVEGDASEIYVGESLRLTLKIWIRPYRDQQLQQRLSEGQMWNQVSPTSNWGSFQSVFDEMASRRQRPGGRSVLRKDAAGNELEYYLYEVDTVIYPDRAERIDGGNVRVVLEYPTRVGRSRSPFSLFDDDDFFGGASPFGASPFEDSFFGRGLRIAETNPIVGQAVVDSIRVKPVPMENRPENYRGAVGQYSIITQASPLDVTAGEPITLRIAIDGIGPLDLVRAPPIEQQQDLLQDFKVPDEPLAGVVDRQRKVFSTMIRARRSGVAEIPAIQFSYFDPETEEFVTTSSDPIPIQVGQAELLALDSIVGAAAADASKPDRLDGVASVSDDGAAKLVDQLPGLNTDGVLGFVPRATFVEPAALLTLMTGPLAALLLLLIRSRSKLHQLVPARGRLRAELNAANDAEHIGEAMERFMASHFRLADSRVRKDQAIGRLRGEGRSDLAVRLERFYDNCQTARRKEQRDLLEALRQEASSLADELISARRGKVGLRPMSRVTVGLTLGVFVTMSAAVNAVELDLSSEQQQTLLREALPIDPALTGDDRQQQLEKSKVKLQTLVDSGIQNDVLYFHLANLYQRTDELGKAAAFYRRALRLNPLETRYHTWLRTTEVELGLVDLDESSGSPDVWFARLRSAVPLRWSLWGFITAWFAFWMIIVARLLGLRAFWKLAASSCLFVIVTSGVFYRTTIAEFLRDDTAVFVVDQVTLLEGDGEEFATVTELASAAGRPVHWIDSRGNWIQVELANGVIGWVPKDTAMPI